MEEFTDTGDRSLWCNRSGVVDRPVAEILDDPRFGDKHIANQGPESALVDQGRQAVIVWGS